MGILIGPFECQSRHRHIIDFDGLHHPTGDARWNLIPIFVHLLKQFDQAALAVLPHVEPHSDDRLILLRHAVDVFNAVDLIQHSFQR